MALDIRRFDIRITLDNGLYYDTVRECNREVPPTNDWVLEDFHSFIRREERIVIKQKNGNTVLIYSNKVSSLEVLKVHEGLDLNTVRERYGLNK